LRKVRVIVT